MQKNIIKLIFIFIFIFLLSTNVMSKAIDEINFITENYPPFNFKEEGKIQGISVDILLLMLKEVQSKQSRKDIKILPWARGYSYLQTLKNTALFSTTRTVQRENLFKWVGPISQTTISLIARKDNHIKINSIHDIHKYTTGVVRDDIGEELLLNKGIEKSHFERTGGIDAIKKLIKMLDKNRFDVISFEKTLPYGK